MEIATDKAEHRYRHTPAGADPAETPGGGAVISGSGQNCRHHFSMVETEIFSLTISTTWRKFFPPRQHRISISRLHFAILKSERQNVVLVCVRMPLTTGATSTSLPKCQSDLHFTILISSSGAFCTPRLYP